MRYLILVLLGVAALVAGAARAGTVGGLFEADVPVSSRETAERERALGAALGQVVVKVTGSRASRRHPLVAQALKDPGRFVQQYGYRSVMQAAGAAAEGAPVLWLSARFEPDLVEALVRDAELPIWGRARPTLVTWLAVGPRGAIELVGADDTSGVGAMLQQAAARRAIPLVLPLLDLEERAAVRPEDLRGARTEAVARLSERYQAPGRLDGVLEQSSPSLWEARWRLTLPEGGREWSDQAQTLGALVEGGVEETADALAARYAGRSTAGGAAGVAVVVHGVRTLEDYARTLRYLGSLEGVEHLLLRGAEADRLRFEADIRGGEDSIRRLVSLGSTLRASYGAVGGGGGAAVELELLP